MENNEKYEASHRINFDNEQQHSRYVKLLAAIQRNDKGDPDPKHSNLGSIVAIMDYITELVKQLREYRKKDEQQTAQISKLNVELSRIDTKYQSTIENQNRRIMQLAEEVQKAQTIEFEHGADSPAESAGEPPYGANDKKTGANGKNDGADDKEPSTFDEFIFNSKNVLVFVSVLLVTVFMITGYILRSEPANTEKPTVKVENTTQVKNKLPSSQHIENKFKRILNNK